jgi:hypothetical protein
MTGDSKGATDALEEAYKTADQSQKGDIAYMLGHFTIATDRMIKLSSILIL